MARLKYLKLRKFSQWNTNSELNLRRAQSLRKVQQYKMKNTSVVSKLQLQYTKEKLCCVDSPKEGEQYIRAESGRASWKLVKNLPSPHDGETPRSSESVGDDPGQAEQDDQPEGTSDGEEGQKPSQPVKEEEGGMEGREEGEGEEEMVGKEEENKKEAPEEEVQDREQEVTASQADEDDEIKDPLLHDQTGAIGSTGAPDTNSALGRMESPNEAVQPHEDVSQPCDASTPTDTSQLVDEKSTSELDVLNAGNEPASDDM